MLGLEILDHVEKMNRWKNGIEVRYCGMTDPLTSNEGVGVIYARHTLGGVWIDADSFLFGAYINGAYALYRYTLSTNAILNIGEGPLYASLLAKEQASGIVWMQGGTSYDVQTYNPTTHALTVVLALAAEGKFAYNSAGVLYFKDAAANYYTCINGALTVTGSPAGVHWLTETTEYTCFINKYGYLAPSAMSLTYGSPTPTIIKSPAAVTKNVIQLWHNIELASGKNTADMAQNPLLGLTTTPYNRLTYAIYQGASGGPASAQLYGDWENALITRTFPDQNKQAWRMKSLIYNMSTDSYQVVPDYLHPSSIQHDTNFGTAGHPAPCVARNYGSYVSVWMLGLTEMTTTKSGAASWYLPLLRFDIPLR